MILIFGGTVPLQFLPMALGAEGLQFQVHAEEIPEPQWKEEFKEVSSHTLAAMALSNDELQALIERCDALLPEIEKLEGAERKIYLKRLEKTKSLFVFVLESRKEGSQ